MNPFDKIIGYASIRNELERTADALRNAENYARLGVSPPRGLLLYGVPGVGKTLMATCLIEASGRRHYICRKDQPNGAFVNVIRNVFDEAAKNAPSIVFLDDLDKFSNNDNEHRDSEELVTVQSCIDACISGGVFVLATANGIKNLPDALIRPGRFDRVIRVYNPVGQDAVEIVRHYLEEKNCVSGIDAESIVRLMPRGSCAELQTAINKGGLIAGYERATHITKRHVLLGCLDIAHGVSPYSILEGRTDEKARVVAYHEAGHAVISEILHPGSVSSLCLYENRGLVSGLTTYCEDDDPYDLDRKLHSAIRDLGGRAATKLRFGLLDAGSGDDIESAAHTLNSLIASDIVYGFHLHHDYEASQALLARQELTVSAKLEECSHQADRILAEHRPLLDSIAAELLRKGLLFSEDIQQARESITDP